MKYPFTVYPMKVNDEIFWAAESSILNGCVAQGETAEHAIEQLIENENVWLETAKELDMPIPDLVPAEPSFYSGKFTVRVSPLIHEQAVRMAKNQGISLNQYVNDAIVEKNSITKAYDSIQAELNELKEMIKPLCEQRVESRNNQTKFSHYSRANYTRNLQILPAHKGGSLTWSK